jgi:hypothetical protein
MRLLPVVDRILQAFARFELGLLRCRYLNLLTGARIAAFRCAALANTKRPETYEADFAASPQGLGNRIEHAIDSTGAIRLGQTGLVRNDGHKIIFVHVEPPSEKSEKNRSMETGKATLKWRRL